jgi:hypothetical protein
LSLIDRPASQRDLVCDGDVRIGNPPIDLINGRRFMKHELMQKAEFAEFNVLGECASIEDDA